jgi:hypothetical protein
MVNSNLDATNPVVDVVSGTLEAGQITPNRLSRKTSEYKARTIG